MAPEDPTPDDPTPDDVDEPEADLLPDDPAEGLAPEAPRVPDPSRNDVDPELKKRFWSLVLLFNVALFAMSLGAMLVGFEGRWQVGGAIFAVGAFAFARGWIRYRKVTGDSGDDETDEADDDGTDDETGETAETDDD